MIARSSGTIIFLSVALIAGLLLNQSSAAQTRLQPPSTPIPESYFGLHVHHLEFSGWPKAQFGALRLVDSLVRWYDLEPKKGQWNWERLDKIVDMAQQHHVQVLYTFLSTPTWASARPNEVPTSPQPGDSAEPKDMNDWRDFVRAVATRYKGRIQGYEIWNEPNNPLFFSGKPETLLAIRRYAYKRLHQVDPSVVVVSPPLTHSNFNYFDTYLLPSAGEYCDAIGYHFYV